MTGLIHGPTIRAEDNSLLSKPGYDERTQLFFDNPNDLEYPESFSALTKEEAHKSLNKLRHLVAEFNFVDKVDESVLLSCLLTTQIRKQIGKAPGFAPTAPDIGIGKSYVADTVTVFATGQLAEAISFSGSKDENSKVLLSTLIEGGAVISFDNIDRPLHSASLSSILTQETYKGRIIGVSKMSRVRTDVTILINGINLRLNADMARRILPIALQSSDKKFQRDACQYAYENRVELNMAGLTIMAAYKAAGCPGLENLSNFSSYGEWSRWVRAPLVWLDMPDPCERLSWWSTFNYEKQLLTMVLHELYDFYGKFEDSKAIFSVKRLREDYKNNTQALHNIGSISSESGNNINSRKLGILLNSKIGTVCEGLMLVSVGTYQGAMQYKVVATEAYVATPQLALPDPDSSENSGAVIGVSIAV